MGVPKCGGRSRLDDGGERRVTAALPAPGADAPSVPTLGLSRSLLGQGPRQAVGFGKAGNVTRRAPPASVTTNDQSDGDHERP